MISTSRAGSSSRRCFGWWLVLLALVPAFSGCGGCRKTPVAAKSAADILKEQEEREKKRREAEKPPIELEQMQILPSDESEPQFYVKPSHFVSTRQSVRANNEDVKADFSAATVNSDGDLYELEHIPFQMELERPAALPKGQSKTVEALYFVPRGRDTKNLGSLDRAWLQRTFRSGGGARNETVDKQPVLPMPEHQYHLVVLAETPDSYAFVRNLHSVKPPDDSLDIETPTLFYRVQIPADFQKGIPVPSQSFAWTSIAYLIWDGIQPNVLTPDQQQAIVDWLHWGGQLIISGPGSLEKLTGSFLEPYLPAARAAAVELRQADFDELNAYWSLVEKKTGSPRSLTVKRESLSGIRLEPAPEATFVPGTATLVCEGTVGRGRILITAFPLTDRDVLNWGSFESFFHNAMLRRPPREYRPTDLGGVTVSFADRPSLTNDPRLGTQQRYFSRDVDDERRAEPVTPAERVTWRQAEAALDRVPADVPVNGPPESSPTLAVSGTDGLLLDLEGYGAPAQSGVAGWNDFSAVSNAARNTLREAAGISIPNAQFVLRIVAVYLLLLVPVNWSFFRLIGRVEWAWLAAPVLAIGASVVVVRLAQLDIGFARSRTEVATLEIQAGYPRAHLTRYTALYTSLSTNYDLEFEDPSAVALPFSVDSRYLPRTHDTLPLVTLRRDRLVRMSGFAVSSNSTGVVHSEQMYDLEGNLDVVRLADDQWQIVNGTALALNDAFVLGKSANGTWEGAKLGTLEPKRQLVAALTAAAENAISQWWKDSPVLSGVRTEQGEVTLAMMLAVATQAAPLAPGDLRLIAWADQDWQGLTIRPAANQVTTRTLIVAHLRRGPRLVPRPDKNLFVDVSRDIKPENESDLDPMDGDGSTLIPTPPIPTAP